MSEKNRIRVRLLPPKDGVSRAQLFVGSAAIGGARSLDQFSDAVQERLKNAVPNSDVVCAPIKDPDPKQLQPIDPAPPSLQFSRTATKSEGSGPSARGPHANAERQWRRPAPTLDRGLFDHNPYNFAEWEGDGPWLPQSADKRAHDRWFVGGSTPCQSGLITLQLKARTPIFVPAGRLKAENDQTDRSSQHFWRCTDWRETERFGIPGSSIKGAVRTLYEALTNSRLGVISDPLYGREIPYRRRSAKAWVIAEVLPNESRKLLRCHVEFIKPMAAGVSHRVQRGSKREAEAWTPPGDVIDRPNNLIDVSNTADWQNLPYRANLLWTDPGNHNHEWKRLYVKVGSHRSQVSPEDVVRYRRNLRHAMYQANPAHAASATMKFYKDPATEERNLDDSLRGLDRLDVGDLIFGVEDPRRPGYLACFGKNVNFLWPSAKAPGALLQGFGPRAPSAQNLTGADYADLAFGFAGADNSDSHPFKGKIGFTTFWAAGAPHEMEAIQLGPLTSPSGTKLKARSLYLAPRSDDLAQTYDEAVRLRGRKFYWHQRSANDGIAAAHLAQRDQAESQLPVPIHPLPAGTMFEGRVVFENLSDVELGALITAVCPGLFFAATGTAGVRKYGLKLGKARPRGLGSVEPTRCNVSVTRLIPTLYARLDGGTPAPLQPAGEQMQSESPPSDGRQMLDDAQVAEKVNAYRKWMRQRAGGRDAAFIEDLEKLLHLPDQPRSCDYLPPQQYGWMPDFEDPAGEPRGGAAARKPAMKRARDY
jgi:CRISPR-associated protein (TIGR03986 family)